MPQNGAKTHGERHTNLVIDRYLVYTIKVVLHRILGGDHFLLCANDSVERSIKRGRFTAAGRACDKHNAVRLDDKCLELCKRFLVQPQLRQAVKNGRLVKDTHYHAFAENHWDHTHAYVHLPASYRELDPTVLR